MTKKNETTTEAAEQPTVAPSTAPEADQEPQEHQEAAEAPDGAEGTDGNEETGNERGHDTDDAEAGPNAEAAKYRRRLRDVEAERDQLRDAAAQVRHDQLTEQLAGDLRHPTDFFALTGTGITDYLTESLEIDQEKVSEQLSQFRQERPDLTHRTVLAGEGESVAVGPELQRTISDAVSKFSRR